MNNLRKETLDDLAEKSRQVDLARFEEKCTIEIQKLKFLLYMKEREISEMYDLLYLTTEFMKMKADKRRMRSMLKQMEQRRKIGYGRSESLFGLENRVEERNLDFRGRRKYDEYHY